MTFDNKSKGDSMTLELDLYQTVAVAVLVFALGAYLRKKINWLEKYCIPAPVIGGILFALMTLFLNVTDTMSIKTDDTMKNVFMMLFFTTVGYTASLKLLKKGGLQVFIFVGVATLLVLLENGVGVMVAKIFNLDPLIGLCVGSIPMVGGHGTAGSFGPLLEKIGVEGATTISVSSATFGLIVGGLIGGPVAKRLIAKHNLTSENAKNYDSFTEEQTNKKATTEEFLKAFSMLFIAAGIGSVISGLIQKTGFTFPSYIGAMLAAAALRNISDITHRFSVLENIIEILGNVSLALFLSMALMSLRLWELATLAIPMGVALLAQTIVVALFAYFVVFKIMGKDYEAAVMSSATCGFGMGATPNAIANMQAITSIYGPAHKAFFIVPLVGSLFIDFINGTILTIFINILG